MESVARDDVPEKEVIVEESDLRRHLTQIDAPLWRRSMTRAKTTCSALATKRLRPVLSNADKAVAETMECVCSISKQITLSVSETRPDQVESVDIKFRLWLEN